jgi:hypothetical protein
MNALLAWSLSQGANVLNVIAGIIVAHLVSPYEFGRFATLSAAIAIMSAVVNPMINEIAQRVALRGAIETAALRSRTTFAVAICFLIGVCACASIITSAFEAFVVCALIPIFLVQHSWATGFFYGLHRMVAFGAVLCVGGVCRVATLLGLIYLGAIFSGISLCYLVSFLLTIVAARYLLAEHTRSTSGETWDTNWKLLCGFFLLALPFSVDQPIVQAILPDVSADYAALMTYSRSVMLLASPALTLVYSASLQARTHAEHTTPTILRSPLVIASVLAAALAFALWLAHPTLFPLLLGTKYSHVTPHLAPALLGMTLYVISYFLIQRMLLSCKWWLCGALTIPPIVQGSLLATQTSANISRLVVVSVVTFALQCTIALLATSIHQRGPSKT